MVDIVEVDEVVDEVEVGNEYKKNWPVLSQQGPVKCKNWIEKFSVNEI